ncbi:IQ calmodulin-binding motif domain-containing protein [Planoprotostelium fungivorum]|uniref:IQ calmodulin-binding motif domain-containing protein n=1 Tax=Planoprotostelium fungivorum TaxID=1890364 RepID=A0A2P6MSR9_9EUKA|nr:IQ calmodulin-binding motif domain-containing protein [Planoprotostelium fungivorum]
MKRREERKSVAPAEQEGPRILKEREVVGLFMSAGILDSVAKSLIKTHHGLLTLNETQGEDFKAVLREALNVIDREGVPASIFDESSNKNVTQAAILASDIVPGSASKKKVQLCKVCRDTGVLHPSYPDRMQHYFSSTKELKGTLKEEDWLCRNCWADFYRDNREWIKNNPQDEQTEEEDAAPVEGRRTKIQFFKSILPVLLIIAQNLHPSALPHRKMLVRYVATGGIQINQISTALYRLRKIGSHPIETEDFERECGVGKYADLFVDCSWDKHPTERDLLHLHEAERQKKKKEREEQAKKEETERLQKEADEKRQMEREADRQEQLEKVEREAKEKSRATRLQRIQEARKKQDAEDMEHRKKVDATKERQREKKEADRRASRKARESELKAAETTAKNKEGELKTKQEDRQRRYRMEAQQRAVEKRTKMIEI